jgi:hypothetical protein
MPPIKKKSTKQIDARDAYRELYERWKSRKATTSGVSWQKAFDTIVGEGALTPEEVKLRVQKYIDGKRQYSQGKIKISSLSGDAFIRVLATRKKKDDPSTGDDPGPLIVREIVSHSLKQNLSHDRRSNTRAVRTRVFKRGRR